LGSERDKLLAAIGPELERKIALAIEGRLRDKETVVASVAEEAVSRVYAWGKLVGIPLGAALAILGIALALLGISSYADFRAKVAAGSAEIAEKIDTSEKTIDSAVAKAQKVAGEADLFESKYAGLESELAKVETIQQKLSTDVSQLKERVGFVSTKSLTPQLQSQLTAELSRYQEFLSRLGFRPPSGRTVEVEITDNPPIAGAIAYYDPGKLLMVIDSHYAANPDFILREYSHRALLYGAEASANSSANPAKVWRYFSVESTLADYFPCSFKNDAVFGAPDFTIDFRELHQFDELRSDWASVVTANVKVWGGAFWAVRQLIGPDVADKLLWDTWFALQNQAISPNYSQLFVEELLRRYRGQGGNKTSEVKGVFMRLGLSLPKSTSNF
jgi:hypothetical protein